MIKMSSLMELWRYWREKELWKCKKWGDFCRLGEMLRIGGGEGGRRGGEGRGEKRGEE